MKHATSAALKAIAVLLARLEAVPRLKRKGIGTFYVGSRPLLHFHEDAAGLFADIAEGATWKRLPVNTLAEQDEVFRSATTFAAL